MRQRLRIFIRRMHFIRSIRFRLALWFVAILAAVLAAFSVFVYARQAKDLENQTLNQLGLKTRKIENYMKYGARDYFEQDRLLLPNETWNGEPLLHENDILALIGQHNKVVQKIGSISDSDVQKLLNAGMGNGVQSNPFSYSIVEASTSGEVKRENFLFIVAPISLNGRVIGFFVLGSPVDPSGQLGRLVLTLVLGNLATLGLALAGGYWLADRAMRPVKTITRAAREIGETDLSRRLYLGTQDELGELADTFDQMLARLQAAFDRQRQFTADASHELRTPLTIVGLETSRALAVKRNATEYERALTVIQSENEFMTRLVNNLLTLSRMDAGQAVLTFEELDLSDIALEVVERLTPLAERRGVAISTGELPELKISGDRQYLSQMVANLVENAIKYSRRSGGRVRVSTRLELVGKQGRQAVGWLQVQDNGSGIAPEHLAHIFDRFYQVDKARSHEPDDYESGLPEGQTSAGSGLGLSIVQHIARLHGGEVSVESTVEAGSTFTVRIPVMNHTEDS